LDIWYPCAPPKEGDCTPPQVYTFRGAIEEFKSFIQTQGNTGAYVKERRQCPVDAISFEYTEKTNPLHTMIRKLQSFVSPNGKKIQVIYAMADRDRILDSFDFSFCAVGYDPKDGKIFGKELELTKNGKGYVMTPAKNEERHKERQEKYERRGFKVIPKPGQEEYVDFMDEIEMFYVCHRDDNDEDNHLSVSSIRQSIQELLEALEKAPRI
jgi:hypothetical protein